MPRRESAQTPQRRSKKRTAIVDSARTLFCSESYAGTSVDAIAAHAGVSKATVYAHFASKSELFTQVLSEVAESYIKLTDDLLSMPVEDGLRHLAHSFVDLVTTPQALAIYRAVLTQGEEFPEMVEAWQAGGPRRVIGAVTRYLEVQTERGALAVPEPHLAARLFLHAVKGDAQAVAMCGTPLDDICHDKDHVINEVVRMMIAAYQPRATAG